VQLGMIGLGRMGSKLSAMRFKFGGHVQKPAGW
jgi:hypothetical protein